VLHASPARLAAMGTQPFFRSTGVTANPNTGVTENSDINIVNGSLWYDDEYNIFYNPSFINDNRNLVTISKGIEAGVFLSLLENFVSGVYFNRGGGNGPQSVYDEVGLVGPGLNARPDLVGTLGVQSLDTQRPLDFFFGGDTWVKWGVHVSWAYNRDQVTRATLTEPGNQTTARYWHVDLGAQVLGLEPFLGTTIFSRVENTGGFLGANQGIQNLNEFNAGLRFKYDNWWPYVVFHKYREGGTPFTPVAANNVTQVQTTMNIWGVGLSHQMKLAEGVTLYKNATFYFNKVKDTTTTTAALRAYSQYIIPFNVALEAAITDWFTLRGSGAFDFVNERRIPSPQLAPAKQKQSQVGTLEFRIGSSLQFSKFQLDWAFGSTALGAPTNLDATNIGFDAQFFSLLSASYRW